jgi:hypothetical protein
VDSQTKPTPERINFEESWAEQCRENEATLAALQERMQETLAEKGIIAGARLSDALNLANLEGLDKDLQNRPHMINEIDHKEQLNIAA